MEDTAALQRGEQMGLSISFVLQYVLFSSLAISTHIRKNESASRNARWLLGTFLGLILLSGLFSGLVLIVGTWRGIGHLSRNYCANIGLYGMLIWSMLLEGCMLAKISIITLGPKPMKTNIMTMIGIPLGISAIGVIWSFALLFAAMVRSLDSHVYLTEVALFIFRSSSAVMFLVTRMKIIDHKFHRTLEIRIGVDILFGILAFISFTTRLLSPIEYNWLQNTLFILSGILRALSSIFSTLTDVLSLQQRLSKEELKSEHLLGQLSERRLRQRYVGEIPWAGDISAHGSNVTLASKTGTT